MKDPELAELNKRVTSAIIRAERLESGPEATLAFREVSEIEEKIAQLTSPDSLEGSIARLGVITAALSSGDWRRALSFSEVYLATAPPKLATSLMALRHEAIAISRDPEREQCR